MVSNRQAKGPFDSSPNENGNVSLEFIIDFRADPFINITTFAIAPVRLGMQVILRRIFASNDERVLSIGPLNVCTLYLPKIFELPL